MKRASILNQTKKFFLITLGIFALIACKKVDASKGIPEDHIVNETAFTAIDFGTGGDLTFTESATTSIIINTTDKVFKAMNIYVENSTLYIGTKKGYTIKNSEDIGITIMAPNVNSLACSGSGSLDANIDNSTEYSSFNLAVSGSGSLRATAINSVNQTMTVSGSGSLTMDEITTENATATISGSGGINVKDGTTINSKATVSGSGNYTAFNLEAENVDVSVSGSGKVEVTANSTLDAVISGSGNVYYKGNPIINVSSSGSGNLINAN
ncbi:MAG: hypothetical protein GQ574_21695 [Crocinitomix sp.]|nr:hypothetical protein [Crocinitomix sp.]